MKKYTGAEDGDFVTEQLRLMTESSCDDEADQVALNLMLMLELHNLPHPNREWSTRGTIGDDLVDRGLSDDEAEQLFRQCVDLLMGFPATTPGKVATHAANILVCSFDRRAIRFCLNKLTDLVATDDTLLAAHNIANHMGTILSYDENAKYRRRFYRALDRCERILAPRAGDREVDDFLERAENARTHLLGLD